MGCKDTALSLQRERSHPAINLQEREACSRAPPVPSKTPMSEDPKARVLSVVERIPDWIRNDLSSKDRGVRKRAEETLAGMIASALNGDNSS